MPVKTRVQPSSVGRRGKQGLTRQRLVEVTLTLLQREGLAAVTSTRIARDGGIAQPGFYAHFSSVEECMRIAIEHALERLRALGLAARERVMLHATEADGTVQDALVSRKLV